MQIIPITVNELAPMLATLCAAQPTEAANFSWGGPAKKLATTLAIVPELVRP
jgi:hypothetical protein